MFHLIYELKIKYFLKNQKLKVENKKNFELLKHTKFFFM